VGEVQPVEYPPQVRVIDPHAFQRGMQLMVALGLREPSQRLRLRQLVSFAYVLLPSPFYDTERKCLRPRLLLAHRTRPMRLFTRGVRGRGILGSSRSPGPMLSGILIYKVDGRRSPLYIRLAASNLTSILLALLLAIRLLRETCRYPQPPRWVMGKSALVNGAPC
jgi:hypothetical protein